MSATAGPGVKLILFILLVGCVVWQCLAADTICMPASAGRLTGNIIGVYDRTQYPASSFRNDSAKLYFKVWPEDISNPRFRFFCQDGSTNLSLANFTISCDERFGKLDPRPYYDVGTANDLQPYYKHWTYSELIPTTDIQLWCERRDMRRLYSHRIWRKTLLPAVGTTIVLWIIVEVTMVAFLCISRWRRAQVRKYLQTLPHERWAHEFLSKYLGGHDTIADSLHLLLLVMAGFCAIEATSHSSSTSWRSTCMLDAAVIYTYLTLFAVLSSFARQLATACRETARDMEADAERKETEMHNVINEHNSILSVAGHSHDDDDATHAAIPRSLSTASRPARSQGDDDDDHGKEGNDWRWQRVFNQFAVVIVMTSFLSYNENFVGDALDDLVSVIWSVIIVAATWSIGVSIVIGARSVVFLVKLVPWCLLCQRHSSAGMAP